MSDQFLFDLNYRPQSPRRYSPGIGIIGCGGITEYHLRAYSDAGFNVVALCDINADALDRRAMEFAPNALKFKDYRDLLELADIEVVDITTHPPERGPIIEESLRADKHVLSQKPFVLDLDYGEQLIELARQQKRYLAVNQNGRWAPHFSYARQVVSQGLIGEVFGAHLSCHWDHTWVKGSEFENIKHLILYDYAIHWFDILRCFFNSAPKRVFASIARAPGQDLKPALLGQAAIEFENGQSTLAFDGAVPYGSHEKTFLSGTQGVLHSFGTGNQQQELTVTNELGSWTPKLTGQWFPDGFHGTMGELLCAIEEERPCLIDAKDNLTSLALCFAAIESAETGESVVPGTIRSMPKNN